MSSQQYFRKFVIFVLLVFTAVSLITTVQAQVPDPPVPSRLDPERFEPLSYLETETTNTSSLRPDSPNATTWGKVVFQSYRDGNWEIYTMDDNGDNQRRLTNHTKLDIQPRFNRGNTVIAFASNRDGDYEIYLMNADGSGLKQLTNNSTDDVNPAWSFDGTKLAFQAYRDGQAEIYTMKSDGTAQTRLTTNTAYEGTPSWSPDGQKIAFVSNRTGGYRIYVMNSQNGSGQTQLTNQAYSFNPTWSPDGKQMAYDADGDGDGWQDLWVMNVDGSNQHVVYNPPGQVDTWVRSWFGKYLVAFTQINYIFYQGNWYWTEAETVYTYYNNGYPYSFNPSYKTDWNPDWQTSDATSPLSEVVQSQIYVQQEILDLTFYSAACYSIYDSGGSGAYFVEVEYKHENDQNWQFFENLYVNDSVCRYFSPAENLGDNRFGWFEFRGRATDNAYNFEAWPSDAEFRILIYEWRLDATTQDVRGNNLENIEIAAGNLLYQTAVPELNEQTFYFPEPVQPTTGWSSNGFLSLPDTTYAIINDYLAETDIYLPPIDNLINDWGFESNNLSLAWGVGAANSAASTAAYHTGMFSAPFDATHRTISQTVTIPGDMTNPTLSFMHRAKSSDENVVVTILDGVTSTSLTFPTIFNWRQNWIDMSPWLGKTITITLGNETSGDSFYVDEVTLGSAHPNIWIDLSGDLAARPGEQLIYEIGFGNDTNLDAQMNIITMMLPTSVNFVNATVPPTVNGNTLTWNVGDLLAESAASSLVVTTTVKASAPLRTMIEAQVTIDSATPEVVLDNNTAVFSTFVGDLLYLPFVTRN